MPTARPAAPARKFCPASNKLTEVTHCCLTGIRLPCGGGRKTNRRVGSEILCHRCSHHFWKKPRKQGLTAEGEIENNDVDYPKYAEC